MPRTSFDLHHQIARTSALRALGAVALAVTLAACSGGGQSTSSTSPPESGTSSSSSAPMSSAAVTPEPAAVASASSAVSAEHNDADIMFAQQMIVHHQGAVAMAMLAQDRAGDPAVRDLASRVQAAQTPEIALMTGWLQAWGAPETMAPGESVGGDGGHDMGSMGMGEDDMATLEGASGAEFDKLFLEQMTVHHQGAVDMAESQQSDGSNPQAIELAGAIVTSQTAEIAEMDRLLQTQQG